MTTQRRWRNSSLRAGSDGVHVIGHSLGGVLALRMLARFNDAPPGRVVCLGSPLCGSRAATFLSEQDWAEEIIGRSLPAGVVHGTASDWACHVGRATRDRHYRGQRCRWVSVASSPISQEDNDGTVGVSETRLAGARDHLVLPVSHKGMLVSRDVADQAGSFLKRGEFLRE